MLPTMKRLRVHDLPQAVAPKVLAGATVVVIDLLRASTTICTALANGATQVRPFLEIDDALRAAEEVGRATVLLGGERGGTIIPGFDLGNSPAEYMPARVAGKQILFTTTNGTRALQHSHLAERIVVGAMVNVATVARSIRDEPNVHILCAGTGGNATREDLLAAGALVSRLMDASNEWQITKQAGAALREWEEITSAALAAKQSVSERLADELRRTPGGENLLAIGHEHDLRLCAQIDTLSVVPHFNPARGLITLP